MSRSVSRGKPAAAKGPVRAPRVARAPAAKAAPASKSPKARGASASTSLRPPALRGGRLAERKPEDGKSGVKSPLLPGGWYDACKVPGADQSMMSRLKSGCLMECEVLDEGHDPRGHVLAELVGQRFLGNGEPLLLVLPIASDSRIVSAWMDRGLKAPNGIYICKGPAPAVVRPHERCYVQLVEQVRVLSRAEALGSWAGPALRAYDPERNAHPGGPGSDDGDAPRMDAPRLDASPLLDAIGARREPEMRGVDELEQELQGHVAGGRRRLTLRVGPSPEMPLMGVLPRHGFPPEPPGEVRAPREEAAAAPWSEAVARAFIAAASEARPSGKEQPELSIRERLASRHGANSLRRLALRILKKHPVPEDVHGPSDSEGDGLQGDRKRARTEAKKDCKKRKKKKRKKGGPSSRSSSSSSSSSTHSDEQLFRGAPGESEATSRAQRDALERPHVVLARSLAEVSRLLPSTTPGARQTLAQVSRSLPALYVPYAVNILEKKITRAGGGPRVERETRTLCEMLDCCIR